MQGGKEDEALSQEGQRPVVQAIARMESLCSVCGRSWIVCCDQSPARSPGGGGGGGADMQPLSSSFVASRPVPQGNSFHHWA